MMNAKMWIHHICTCSSTKESPLKLCLLGVRAAYLHGHIWGKTLVPKISPLSPSEWGWIINQLHIHVVQREFTEFPHVI